MIIVAEASLDLLNEVKNSFKRINFQDLNKKLNETLEKIQTVRRLSKKEAL